MLEITAHFLGSFGGTLIFGLVPSFLVAPDSNVVKILFPDELWMEAAIS